MSVDSLATYRPQVTHLRTAPDLEEAEAAAAAFIRALGIPLDDPGLADTPRRLANAYANHNDVPHN